MDIAQLLPDKTDMSKAIAIEQHRAASGLSQAAASARAGVSPGTGLRIEAGGGVNADSLVLWALALGRDPVRVFESWMRKSPRWARLFSRKEAS